MQSVLLPPHVLPPPGARVLVIAPHCDDETLGVGGLIVDAIRHGAQVSIAFVTNGDGFPMAVSREYRCFPPRAADYRRMARIRQEEARSALACLGVPGERIYFLGYPDGGIAELWNQHWQPDEPYRSRFTECDSSPYGNSYHPGSRYCGQALMGDLESLLQRVHPDVLYIPHPGDDHPDHWATHCFSMAALEDLRLTDETHAQTSQDGAGQTRRSGLTTGWQQVGLFTYLVHRGDWPVPQGLWREARLVPPAPLVGLDTRWSSRALSREAESRKEKALLCYRSQTAVMKRFLTSFVRRDELFGALPPEELVPEDHDPDHWVTAISDTTGDTLLRGIEGSGDLTTVKVVLSSERLRLRVATRLPLSPRLTYTIRLHPLGLGPGGSVPCSIPIHRLQSDEDGVSAQCMANELTANMPLSMLGRPAALMLGADSRLGRMSIDRVCWRLIRLRSITPSSLLQARFPRRVAR
jgi:LmbE family N-acetylglucosaminyl deacetylase